MFIKVTPSIWLGQGLITMRGIAEQLRFFTRWTIDENVTQEVEIQGHAIKQTNFYTLTDDLCIRLENEELGLWEGQVKVKDHHLSWKLFSADKTLFGEEHFFHLDNGRVKTRAVFSDMDGPYTVIEGEIWRAATSETRA